MANPSPSVFSVPVYAHEFIDFSEHCHHRARSLRYGLLFMYERDAMCSKYGIIPVNL